MSRNQTSNNCRPEHLDGRCWHCLSTMPNETSPCDQPVMCFRCLQPGHRVTECSNPKHKYGRDNFNKWRPAGGAKRGGFAGGQQGAKGPACPHECHAAARPIYSPSPVKGKPKWGSRGNIVALMPARLITLCSCTLHALRWPHPFAPSDFWIF